MLRILRWLSVTPFGYAVVPEVYWMFTGSLPSSLAAVCCSAGRSGSAPASASQRSLSSKITSARSGHRGPTSASIAA
ncbi:Uncharacterised protein [Mycobacterium tuberculosis]|nr:Uncharacterised protein [Mycobacterium tuberculosis]